MYLDSLVAHYDMSTVGTVPNICRRTYGTLNGTTTGLVAATDLTNGVGGGKAIEFNGADESVYMNSFIQRNYSSGAAFCFFKAKSTSANGDRIFSMGQSDDRIGLNLVNGNRLRVYSKKDGGVVSDYFGNSNTLNDDTWRSVCVNWSSVGSTMIVDGEIQTASDTGDASLDLITNDPLFIGSYLSGGTNFFDGCIDEFLLFSEPLTLTNAIDLNYRIRMGKL